MNRFIISVCVLAAIACGSGLLSEANKHGQYGEQALFGGGHGLASEYLGGGGYEQGYGAHGGHGAYGLGGHSGYGSGSGYGYGYGYGNGGHQGGFEHGLGGYNGHHNYQANHQHGNGHHGSGHSHGHSSGQVRALLKGAARSALASNPELARKVDLVASDPLVRRGVEKLKPKVDSYARKAKPYVHEGGKVLKHKLADAVNSQNAKHGYPGEHYL